MVTAVGGRDVIIKKISMDRMKEGEAREQIRWEAEQHVPFDMDNVELDFQILDPEGEGLQMAVLLVAAKRELVETKQTLLSEVGLEAGVIDVDAFALHNAFELNYPDAMHGVVGLVNIGHEMTNVNILDEGVPVLTRDIMIGTRRFREDLQRERNMSADEADQLLRGFERNEALEPLLASRGEELAVGIERAAAFLQSSAGRRAASPGSLPPAAVRGFPASIASWPTASGCRCSRPTRWSACRWRKACSTVAEDEVGPLLMLPMGLALRTAA